MNIRNPMCKDYNECTDPRFSETALEYCGENTICENRLGSYRCPCLLGYENFSPKEGCVDIDECGDSSYNYNVTNFCGANTDCHNTWGWSDMPDRYNCSCSQGYEEFIDGMILKGFFEMLILKKYF